IASLNVVMAAAAPSAAPGTAARIPTAGASADPRCTADPASAASAAGLPSRSRELFSRSNCRTARSTPARTRSSSTPIRTRRFDRIATVCPLSAVAGVVDAAHGAGDRLGLRKLLLPRLLPATVPLRDEVRRSQLAALLAAVDVG